MISDQEKEIRKILDSIVREGTYSQGHILWIKRLIAAERVKLQNDLKELLDIRDCNCE